MSARRARTPEWERSRELGRTRMWSFCGRRKEPCQACRSCLHKRMGIPAVCVRDDGWTAEEDALLRRLEGQATPLEISAALREQLRCERTPEAVIRHAQRLGVSLTLVAHSPLSIAALFGITEYTVIDRWMKPGHLAYSLRPTGRRGAHLGERLWRWVSDEDLETLVREKAWLYDYQRMRQGRWRNLAEVIFRSDPWLVVDEALPLVGVPRRGVSRRAIYTLPTVKSRYGYRYGAPYLVVQRSRLEDFASQVRSLIAA